MPEVMSIEVDEEFDPRPPQTPFGLRGPEGQLNIPLIAGIAIAILLILALIFVVIKPFGGKATVAPSTWKPNNPTKNVKSLPVYAADSQMVVSIQASMEDWAEFYTTGDLEILQNSFDLAGPQYAAIVKEQPKVAATPDPGDPAVIDLSTVREVTQKDKLYTVRTTVTWTKPGGSPNVFKWDIIMKRVQNGFVLNKTSETDPTKPQPIDFCGSVKLIAQLESNAVVSKELDKLDDAKRFDALMEIFDIRLKTYSYLQEVAKGTDDQEAVDSIVEELNASIKAGKETNSIDEAVKAANEFDNDQNFADLNARAQDQCEIKLIQ